MSLLARLTEWMFIAFGCFSVLVLVGLVASAVFDLIDSWTKR